MKSLPEPEIIMKKGKPISVSLPIDQYQGMLRHLENAEGVAWPKKARRKNLHYLPPEEVLTNLVESCGMYQVTKGAPTLRG